jgi:hypothetical protein
MRLQYPPVTVSKCSECQHTGKKKGFDWCGKAETMFTKNNDGSIPSWCPLPTVEETIKALEASK